MPEPFKQNFLGTKLVIWIFVALILLVASLVLSGAAFFSNWVWQGDDYTSWTGDLGRITQPGTAWELVSIISGLEVDDWFYADLADFFCNDLEDETGIT
jgi:hypothetical protein